MIRNSIKPAVDAALAGRIDVLEIPDLHRSNLVLHVKREDLVHPLLSGNKWRKLKYNIELFKQSSKKGLLTFGGAFSNHIAATAFAGNYYNIRTVGVIRGEKPRILSRTLERAIAHSMQLHFISRSDYRNKEDINFLTDLDKKFPDYFVIPEGGANESGVKGCEEILNDLSETYDYIICPCGTGTTMAGILRSAKAKCIILGIACHTATTYLKDQLQIFAPEKSNYEIIGNYHFGGFARRDSTLDAFVQKFNVDHNIPVEFVYSGKMFYAVFDLIKKGYFPVGSKLLCIHTGGLQYTLTDPVI